MSEADQRGGLMRTSGRGKGAILKRSSLPSDNRSAGRGGVLFVWADPSAAYRM